MRGCRIASGVELKDVSETGLDGGVQRLIDVVRNRSERAGKPRDCIMRIQRIRIMSGADAECPGQFRRHFPGVLRIQIQIQEIVRLGVRERKGFDAVEATP